MSDSDNDNGQKRERSSSFMSKVGWALAAGILAVVGAAFLLHAATVLVGGALLAGAAYSVFRAFKSHKQVQEDTSSEVSVNEQNEGRGYSQTPGLQPMQQAVSQPELTLQQREDEKENFSALPSSSVPSNVDSVLYPEWSQPSSELSGASASSASPSAGQAVS